ncbi:MAG: hypothetical protein ABIS47_10100, partial [Acidimicrobiales bacterium]
MRRTIAMLVLAAAIVLQVADVAAAFEVNGSGNQLGAADHQAGRESDSKAPPPATGRPVAVQRPRRL